VKTGSKLKAYCFY